MEDDKNLERVFKKIIKGFETIERFIEKFGDSLSQEELDTIKDKIKILEMSANSTVHK